MVSSNRTDTVTFEYDERAMEALARKSGSKRVKESVAYIRRAHYYNPDKTFTCRIGESAFFAGTIAKDHFRLLEIAVLQDAHGQGYGRKMMEIMKAVSKQHKLKKITLRTSKEETAVNFFTKFGGVIVGEKGKDWEMEIRL